MTDQQSLGDELLPPIQSPLNELQQVAHDRTVGYVTNTLETPPKIMLIEGFAGTGKTFTINRIIETLKRWSNQQHWDKKLKIVAVAPTHKAVRVLRKNAELGNVEYATLHSLLALKPDTDYKTGAKIFVPSKDPEDGRIAEFNVVIADEVSMAGKDLWDELMRAMDEEGFKLILLGDPAQIPPVNEMDSPAFIKKEDYGIETVTLTQSMRQLGEHPVLDYATSIRNTYKGSSIVEPEQFEKVNDKGHGIQIINRIDTRAIESVLEDKFGSPRFKADADYMKVIAWTNATVDAFNKRIRRLLYAIPEGMMALPMIINGEKLILDERYLIPSAIGNQTLATNEELEVVNYQLQKQAVRYKLWTPMGYTERTLNPQIYWTTVQFKNSKNQPVKVDIRIVHESSQVEVKKMMDEIKESAKKTTYGTPDRVEMWKHFYYIDGMFAKVKYNYAVTAHKSQGSTYDNCMLALWDINNNRRAEERNRITYVGASRAREMLYILK